MSTIKEIQIGLNQYGKALPFILKNKLSYLFLFPLALNLLLFFLGFSLAGGLSEMAIDALNASWQPETWTFWGAEIIAGTLGFIVWFILKLFLIIFFAFVGGYLVLIILAPVLGFVSEKTEQIVNGKDFPFNLSQLIKDMIRGILLAVRNFFYELFFILLLFLLSFIPVIGLITAPILFVLSAYFYGFSFIDYTSERRKVGLKDSVHYVKRHKGLAIGSGSVYAGVLLIPIIGVSLAGFIAIISTVAATLSIIEMEKQKA